MKQLDAFVKQHQQEVQTLPADAAAIAAAEQALKITFSAEYKNWLSQFGVLSYASHEVFGLGVKQTSWLNIMRSTSELREENNTFPATAVPLMDAGDGFFYIYDNASQDISVWSSLAGIVEKRNEPLEQFILNQLTADQ